VTFLIYQLESVKGEKNMLLGKKAREMEINVLQETFRVLKSNIQFCNKDNRIKTITITSCSPGEGKTTVALNLAATLAGSGIRTLLVNAEFRKQIKKSRKKKDNQAISGVDSQDVDSQIVCRNKTIKDTIINNLSYLSIGSSLPDPELLIDSLKLRSFINELGEKFDMVIIDAPPLGGVIDSALIASATDAAILVIRSGLHEYRTVQQVKEQLEKANVRLLGVVLSRMDGSSFRSYFNYQKYCRSVRLRDTLELEQLNIINE